MVEIEDAWQSVDDIKKMSDRNDVIRSSDGIEKTQWTLPCVDGETENESDGDLKTDIKMKVLHVERG